MTSALVKKLDSTFDLDTKERRIASAAGVARFHAPIGTLLGRDGKPIPTVSTPGGSVVKDKLKSVHVTHNGDGSRTVEQHSKHGTLVTQHSSAASADAHIGAILGQHDHLNGSRHILGGHHFQVSRDGKQVTHQDMAGHGNVDTHQLKKKEDLTAALHRIALAKPENAKGGRDAPGAKPSADTSSRVQLQGNESYNLTTGRRVTTPAAPAKAPAKKAPAKAPARSAGPNTPTTPEDRAAVRADLAEFFAVPRTPAKKAPAKKAPAAAPASAPAARVSTPQARPSTPASAPAKATAPTASAASAAHEPVTSEGHHAVSRRIQERLDSGMDMRRAVHRTMAEHPMNEERVRQYGLRIGAPLGNSRGVPSHSRRITARIKILHKLAHKLSASLPKLPGMGGSTKPEELAPLPKLKKNHDFHEWSAQDLRNGHKYDKENQLVYAAELVRRGIKPDPKDVAKKDKKMEAREIQTKIDHIFGLDDK